MDDPLSGFSRSVFEHAGDEKTVFRAGQGPGVLVMSEIPGITPEVAGLARFVAEGGFTVLMPDLFGKAGQAYSLGYNLRSIGSACISREFTVLSTRRRSAVTEWLRALARHAHAELGGVGVGAIGMCLTGNFALALMLDEAMQAPVLSQPSLPFPLSAKHKRALHLGPGEVSTICQRDVPVLGLRFTGDRLCPKARFDHLREQLGERFEAIEIDSTAGNEHGIPRTAHSVLTLHLVDEEGHPTWQARQRVLAFLRERLGAQGSP